MDDNNVSNVIPDLEEFQVDFDEVVNVGGGTTDFNELTNLPKYDGQTMSGNTDIPKVPEKTSDLNNDSDYQTGTEVQEAINDSISQINIPTKTSDLTNDGADGTSTYVEADNLPTVNDATLTINQNGVTKGTFTANDSDNETVDLTDTTYSDFTGTDGTAAGTAGLVPAPATTDAGKFLKADGTWDTAGGGGVTPVQTTGTSTTDVMSQKATTDMVYSDKSTSAVTEGGAVYIGSKNADQQVYSDPTTTDLHYRYFWALPGGGGTAHTVAPGSSTINIGGSQQANTESNTTVGFASKSYNSQNTLIGYQTKGVGSCVCAGESAQSSSVGGVVLGCAAQVNANNVGSVALGANARTTRAGEVYVGTNNTSYGYNSTNYRVIGGVHDPIDAHDATTKNYVDSIVINYATLTAAGAPTTSTAATSVGQLYYDSTNDDYYYCSAIDTTGPNNPVYTWSALSTGGGGGVTPVQTTGTSTTDVMSQDATTKLIYPDIANYPYKQVIGEGIIAGTNRGVTINGNIGSAYNSSSIAIGAPDGNLAQVGSNGRANGSIAIGSSAAVGRGMYSVAIGYNSFAHSGQDTGGNTAIGYSSFAGNRSETSAVALGAYAKTTRTGEVNIGTGGQNQGYNSTDYRVIGGVHDGQLAQDAVTVAQVNATIDAINTALSTSIPHIGAAS